MMDVASLPTLHDLAVELDEAFMEAWARHLPALPVGYEDCWTWADTHSRKDRVAAVKKILAERRAAPELLAACEAALVCIHNHDSAGARMCREAIAKHEGAEVDP